VTGFRFNRTPKNLVSVSFNVLQSPCHRRSEGGEDRYAGCGQAVDAVSPSVAPFSLKVVHFLRDRLSRATILTHDALPAGE
jgi:hypothetical protein